MEVIKVGAGPNDLNKLSKRAAPFRQPGFIRCQVARNNVRKIWRYLKMPAATQVGRRVDRLRLAKVGVRAPAEFSWRTGAVAAIAVSLCVDNIAAQSHQRPVLSRHVQRHRRDLESLLNFR